MEGLGKRTHMSMLMGPPASNAGTTDENFSGCVPDGGNTPCGSPAISGGDTLWANTHRVRELPEVLKLWQNALGSSYQHISIQLGRAGSKGDIYSV